MTAVSSGLNSTPIIAVIALLCCAGLISNVLVLLVLYRNKRFRHSTDFFVANIALCDIVLNAVAVPININQALRNQYGMDGFIGGR